MHVVNANNQAARYQAYLAFKAFKQQLINKS
jgi:hypothetical protein